MGGRASRAIARDAAWGVNTGTEPAVGRKTTRNGGGPVTIEPATALPQQRSLWQSSPGGQQGQPAPSKTSGDHATSARGAVFAERPETAVVSTDAATPRSALTAQQAPDAHAGAVVISSSSSTRGINRITP